MQSGLRDRAGDGGGLDGSYQNSAGVGGQATYFDNIDRMEKPMPDDSRRKTIVVFGRELERDLLVAKGFYLCFFSAFGSLFPLIAVYFKQIGLTATQTGLLIGVRPFVEFLSAPFWGQFSDKFRKGRLLMLFTLACWIVFTDAVGYVRPGVPYCLAPVNGTPGAYTLVTPDPNPSYNLKEKIAAPGSRTEPNHTVGMSPIALSRSNILNYDEEKMGVLVRPPFSYRIYSSTAVTEVFMLLLLLICLGEFFSGPAIQLADACTLSYLDDRPQLFGKQRLFGSVGWGFAMLLMGILLDNSEAFPRHPCKFLKDTEKNYTFCFAMFTVFMLGAVLVATQFQFHSDHDRPDEVPSRVMDAQMVNIDAATAEKARARAPEASSSQSGPEWLQTLKTFKSPPHAAFLLVTWWMGFGVGLVFSFLFWHLQDLGGSPTLFGIASVINHASEMVAYFYSFQLINKIGHIKVLYLGLVANAGRFFLISVLKNPFFVLPFEFIQGLTHAAVWAAATSYISLASPPSQKASAQHVLRGLHLGIGKGLGAIVSGFAINYLGTQLMFAIYGFSCLLMLGGFYGINRFMKADGIKYGAADFDDDVGAAVLAPHGIPMGVPFKEQAHDYGATEEPMVVSDPTQDAYDKYILQERGPR